MAHYICPKCGRDRSPRGRMCPQCRFVGPPKAVEGQGAMKSVAQATVPISATPQQANTVPVFATPQQSQPPTVIVLEQRSEKKSEPGGLTGLQTLLLIGIIMVGVAIWYVWRNPGMLTKVTGLSEIPAFISTVEGVTGQEPTINPQPVYDPQGKVTGCAEGGTFIEFVGGNPSFLDEKGTVVSDLLPKVSEQASWYCFDPEAWKKWLELPVPTTDYDNSEALTRAIMKYSGLESQAWKDAIATALRASIGQSVLVLPAKTKEQQVSVPAQPQQPPQDYNPPSGGSDLSGEVGGGREVPTPFQPATDTPEPTATFSPEEAEKLQIRLALEANLGSEVAQKAEDSGDDEASFKFPAMDLMDILGLSSAEAKLMPILSPEGLVVRQKDSGEYYAVSARRALDGRYLFKTGKITGFSSSVPDGGTWLAAGGEIHWEQQLLSGDPNVWGSDSRGFEVPWKSVWVYPVTIPHSLIPGAPTPTIDIGPIITAVQAFPSVTPQPDAPTQPPAPTATPTPTGIDQLQFVNTVYAAGMNQQGWYGSLCSKYYWQPPGYIATCSVGGNRYNVSFWISALNVDISTTRFWYRTDASTAPQCYATLPAGWYICLVP